MFDEHAVAVRRDKSVVGHLLHEISRFFVHKRHSKMTCEITGYRHDSSATRDRMLASETCWTGILLRVR